METTINYKASNLKKWLVIYTRPRWEKKVERLLQQQGIEAFCPVRNVMSQWADRKKMVSLPLFTSYVFVRIHERDEYKVRYTLGVLNFVYYMQHPAVIRDVEIEKLKRILDHYQEIEVLNMNDIARGDRVRIKSGLFNRLQGEVIQVQGKNVLMAFDHLDCALVTRVPITDLIITHKQQQSYA